MTASNPNESVKGICDKADSVVSGRHLFRLHLFGVMDWRVRRRIPFFISAQARLEEHGTCDVSGYVARPESDRTLADLDDGPRRRIYGLTAPHWQR